MMRRMRRRGQENEKSEEEEGEEGTASAGSLPHEPVQGGHQPGSNRDPRSQIKYTQIKQSQIEPATNPANQEIKEAFGWGEGGKYPGSGRNEERGINEIE